MFSFICKYLSIYESANCCNEFLAPYDIYEYRFFNYSILCNDRCCHGATYLVQNQSDNKFIRYGEGNYDYDYDLINKINCPR